MLSGEILEEVELELDLCSTEGQLWCKIRLDMIAGPQALIHPIRYRIY